jgi:4-diphosphocytidyl-2-C-methyl-D-erythritol kinase
LDIEAKAFAKINLHLEVLNRRPDGYHNIFSLMARVGLFDLLKLEDAGISGDPEKPVSVEVRTAGGEFAEVLRAVPAGKNLITRAAAAYFRRQGISGDIALSVEKNIPAGAGLGGGSSDAAAVLLMLNDNSRLFGVQRLAQDELAAIGAGIGSDVPYCLAGGFAICEGTGEIIVPVRSRLDRHVLIAYVGIHVDTGKAYGSLHRTSESPYGSRELEEKRTMFKRGLENGDLGPMKRFLRNDFESTVLSAHPELNTLKQRIEGEGAEYAALTGSGSAVIGLFGNAREASRAGAKLRDSAVHVFVTKFLQTDA